MEITKNQLRQLITEVLKEAWPDDVHPESKWASGPVYQINDVLVTALQRALFEQFLEAGLIGKGPGQMHENDLALEFEEPLMDALMPIAERASLMLGHDPVYSQPEEDYGDDEEYTMLPRPKTDPMSRPPSPQRKRAMAHFEKTVGPDWLKESLAEVLDTLEEG